MGDHAAQRNSGWSWDFSGSVASAQTPVERWATLVLCGCNADRDPATIRAWASSANSCETTIHATCKLCGLSARDSRDFARVLRALRMSSGSLHDLETYVNVADPRTLSSLLRRAGLQGRPPSEVLSFDQYLQLQRFVPRTNRGLVATRALLRRM